MRASRPCLIALLALVWAAGCGGGGDLDRLGDEPAAGGEAGQAGGSSSAGGKAGGAGGKAGGPEIIEAGGSSAAGQAGGAGASGATAGAAGASSGGAGASGWQGGEGGGGEGGGGEGGGAGAGGGSQAGAAGAAGTGGEAQGGAAGAGGAAGSGGAAGEAGASGGEPGGSGGEGPGGSGGAAGEGQGGSGGAAGEAPGGAAGSSGSSGQQGGSSGSAGAAGGACDAVGAAYLVDPVNGDDAIATGSGTEGGAASAACAFRTLTAAFGAIGAGNAAPLEVVVVGPSSLSSGEAYPLVLPPNVRVNTKGGTVTAVPGSGAAFVLSSPGSSIDAEAGLVVDGQPSAGASQTAGLVAQGACDASCFVGRLAVQGARGDGVLVTSELTIGAGLTVAGAQPTADGVGGFGLRVGGKGKARVKALLADGSIAFLGNASGGMVVEPSASLSVVGQVDLLAQKGSVWADQNAGPGLAVLGGSAVPSIAPTVDVDGLVVSNTTGASGVRIEAGSSVRLRGSVSIGNQLHGVEIVSSAGGNNVSRIDLGTKLSSGKNVVGVGPQGSGDNGRSGIALAIPPPSGPLAPQTLSAVGNDFGPGKDCSSEPASLTRDASATCSGAADVCVPQAVNGANSVDVSLCTYP